MITPFDQLIEAVPDAALLVDPQGVIITANARARTLFGYEDRDLAGENVDALVPERARVAHQQHRVGYMAQPQARPMGSRGHSLIGRRRDGSEFSVEIALGPLQTEAGPCFLASIRDVSESQRVRQALDRSRYDRLVARVGELALMSSDEESVMVELPREIAKALPADAVAIVTSRPDSAWALLRADVGLDEVSLSDLKSALGSGSAIAEASGLGKGLTIDDLTSADSPLTAPVLNTAGFRSALLFALAGREGQLGTLVALSRQPGSFDEDSRRCLGQVANLLSAFIQRRHTEEQLAHSQRLDAVGRLTGGIAHDFNNLLTVVSGNLQLIEISCPEFAHVKEMLRGAHRAVDSAAQLTAKLLAFARRQNLSPQWIDTPAMLREMVALLQRTLGETIDIEMEAFVDLPPLFADRAQLDSALLNLALNARDAMPRGGQLRIEVRTIDLRAPEAGNIDVSPGPFLSLVVTDTGLGMPPEILEHIFEPFFTTKPPGKGNGLGLSMVYGFVRQSGGHVRAASRLGYGTRIELLLPLRPDGPDATVPVPVDAAMIEAELGGHEHILVVEDDQEVRAVTASFLRSLGYRVNAVSTAEHALDFIARHTDLALVLSDVVLGSGKSGVQLAQDLQTLRAGLPVLLTSGYEHETLQQLGIASSPFELLRKPYRRDQLALMLRRKLAQEAG